LVIQIGSLKIWLESVYFKSMGSDLNMGRLLVTTALEETWGGDVPVLFLGEGCRLYSRKHIWSKMDALVAKPFGMEPEEMLSSADFIDGLTSQILSELTGVLNEHHKVQYSERYWNILLGHWLKRYVSVAFNRYYTLDQALKNYEVTGTSILKDVDYDLATSDSLSFIWVCNDDRWNHTLYSRIMTFRGDIALNQVLAHSGGSGKFVCEVKRVRTLLLQASGMRQKLLIIASLLDAGVLVDKSMKWMLNVISPRFRSDTDAFIISSYLPIKEDIKLHFALGQVPQYWRSLPFKQVGVDSEQRASLKLNYDHFKAFEKYVRWQLPEVIPTCYLEGYKNLIAAAEKTMWPKKAKFIFTSNCFDTDEVFKVWTALKVEQGTPYFVGQHGSNYGTHTFWGNKNSSERMTSDKFITWGWKEVENDIPAFVFTKVGAKPREFDSAGGLLLIENPLMSAIYYYDVFHKFEEYIEGQFLLAQNLPEHIQGRLTVRLHSAYRKMRSFEDLRWKDYSPYTKIDRGLTDIRALIKLNRLIVHSYDSSGILETLAMNIPTMCFWRDGLNHLLPSAKPYYELLVEAGILFFSPEKAARSIALHWDDIDEWWESKKVQDARQKFCDQYARTVPHPIQKLKEMLTENL
jgi:putative transferase (TIGR04331 family)